MTQSYDPNNIYRGDKYDFFMRDLVYLRDLRLLLFRLRLVLFFLLLWCLRLILPPAKMAFPGLMLSPANPYLSGSALRSAPPLILLENVPGIWLVLVCKSMDKICFASII